MNPEHKVLSSSQVRCLELHLLLPEDLRTNIKFVKRERVGKGFTVQDKKNMKTTLNSSDNVRLTVNQKIIRTN